MKFLALIAVTLFLNFNLTAQELDPKTQLLCVDQFSGETYDLMRVKNRPSCLADLIWGSKNICYTGQNGLIVELMNNKFFNNTSSGLIIDNATSLNVNTIEFTGVDQMSFWMQKSRITRCQ